MGTPKVVPSYIEATWKLLQKHYNGYMDQGGSHAEYMLANTLTEAEGKSLFKEYKKTVAKRKKS